MSDASGDDTGSESSRGTYDKVYSPSGDLVLVAGLGERQRKFQIDSIFLVTSSRVFAAMLGPNFREGRRLRDGGDVPMELALPDDDPAAVGHLCEALYATKAILAIDSEEVYKVAVLINKYDLKDRLYTLAYYWLQDPVEEICYNAVNSWFLMLAAYWLNEPRFFYFYSEQLARHHSTEYKTLGLALDLDDHSFGLSLCYALEQLLNGERSKGGLCLHCFKIAQGGRYEENPNCWLRNQIYDLVSST